MTLTLDPLFVPAEDRHLVNVQRYRCEYVCLSLWRIVHERAHWRQVSAAPTSNGGASSGMKILGAGEGTRMSAHLFDVRVPAHARLNVLEHGIRIWRGEVRKAMEKTLKPEESHALNEWLLKERHSGVFRVHGDRVWRNEGVSEELARAALKLMAGTVVIGAGR